MKNRWLSLITAVTILSFSIPALAEEAENPEGTAPDQEQVPEPQKTPNLGVSQEVHERNEARKEAHRAEVTARKQKLMEKKAAKKAARAQRKNRVHR